MRASSSLPVVIAIAVLFAALAGYRYTRPLPARGSAAVAVEGLGIVGMVGDEQPRPIASVTKMMTAYVILKSKPLKLAEPGPMITTTAADIALYRRLIAQDESVVAVSEGTRVSQYDM